MATHKRFQVRLKDIAERVHVSCVTVSKALRNHPDISDETKKIIRQVALEMAYIPDYVARNLSANNTFTIGVVLPKIAHPFFSVLVDAIYEAAWKKGYEIILCVSQEDADRELQQLKTLVSMRVDGIIISISEQTKDPTFFFKIKELGIPLVFLDRALDVEGFSKVIVNDRDGAFTATEQALKVGYTRIAHISGYPHMLIGKERLLGYNDAMLRYEIPLHPEWIVTGGFGEQDGYDGFMRLYRTRRIPDCIFTVTSSVALGVYRAVKEMKLRIIEDVDIISFGNSAINRLLSPALTYIEQPTLELGRTALELTIRSIEKKEEYVPETVVLPTHLVLQETCRKSLNRASSSALESMNKVEVYSDSHILFSDYMKELKGFL